MSVAPEIVNASIPSFLRVIHRISQSGDRAQVRLRETTSDVHLCLQLDFFRFDGCIIETDRSPMPSHYFLLSRVLTWLRDSITVLFSRDHVLWMHRLTCSAKHLIASSKLCKPVTESSLRQW
jgi:hypothetical protein